MGAQFHPIPPPPKTNELVRYCYRCKTYLNKDMFYNSEWEKRGYKACKKCAREMKKVCYDRQKRNPDFQEKIRNRHLKRIYGITVDQYTEMLYNQNGRCKICGRIKNTDKRKAFMHVDHCHKTGKVRGVLCGQCNSMLGNANDDVSILYKAIEYIKNEGQLTIHL